MGSTQRKDQVSGITEALALANKLLAAVETGSHHEELVKLKESLLSAQQEVLSLREELLDTNSRLSASIQNQTTAIKMKFDGVFYWTGPHTDPESGPFCPRCFDAEKKQIRLQNHWSDQYSCPACDKSFSGPNAKRELSKPSSASADYDPFNPGDLG